MSMTFERIIKDSVGVNDFKRIHHSNSMGDVISLVSTVGNIYLIVIALPSYMYTERKGSVVSNFGYDQIFEVKKIHFFRNWYFAKFQLFSTTFSDVLILTISSLYRLWVKKRSKNRHHSFSHNTVFPNTTNSQLIK